MEQSSYLELLSLYVAASDIQEFLLHPYPVGDYICATNRISIISIPAAFIDHTFQDTAIPSFKRATEITLSGIHSSGFCHVISLEALNEAISFLPTEPEMITSGEDIKCSECGGEGTVEWEYSDKNDRSYFEYFDCPVCDGTGYIIHSEKHPSGRMVPYPHSTIGFRSHNIAYSQLSLLVKSMQILGVPHIRFVAQKGNISYFRLTDDITVGIAHSVCKASHVLIPDPSCSNSKQC